MKGEPGHTILTVVVAALLIVFAGTLLAQDARVENMEFVLQKIKADKKLLVAENMQLTADEAKAFWPVYDRYQDELFLLRVRTGKMINDYADAMGKMNDEIAKLILNEYFTIETLRLKLRKAYLPRFNAVLPGAKVLRYYQIENKLNLAVDYDLSTRIPLVVTEKK